MTRYLIIFASLFLLACNSSQQTAVEDIHDHGEETIALTVWTDQLELFMEYNELHAGEPAHFIIHLTDQADFQPLREGRIQLEFTSHDGVPVVFTEEEPVRDGIF